MTGRPDAAPAPAHAAVVEGLLRGEPRALARAITAVENSSPGSMAILAAIQPHLGRARIVGVTGPPGAGKSTLIDAVIRELRRRERTVGVLAVDPSSPISGGAVLGDRVRMGSHAADRGVFVRSLASRGHLGGLFRAAWGVVQVMDAYGPDFIVLETVGSGQSEVEIADCAHLRVVLCPPGAGDDIQAIKAGVLEIADVLVVNKADHPLAEQTVRQLEAMLALRSPSARRAQVLSTVASSGQGVPRLVDLLTQAPLPQDCGDGRPDLRSRLRRIFAEAAARALRERVLSARSPALEALCDRLVRCEIDLDEAVEHALSPSSQPAPSPAGRSSR